MTEPQAHTALHACENCGSVLQGGYCHVCGQHAHSPLRNVAHAVQEVFESFWHLDGRIFRTVRDLCVPGRVAAGYLAGHRVRYIAPLRLFVILSLLTFFVGKATLHIDDEAVFVASPGDSPVKIDVGDDADRGAASATRTGATATRREPATIEAVIADRNRQVAEFRREALESDAGWLLAPFAGMMRSSIDEAARAQMRRLGASDPEIDLALARADPALERAAGAGGIKAKSDDADAGWLSRWMQKRVERIKLNSEAIRENPDEFVRLFLGALPGALFLLVPLFALFLKIMYIGSGRGYLEHLVVALYSHAFLLAVLLLVFVLTGLTALAPTAIWPKVAMGIAATGLLFAVPAYLLVMQRRVYAQRWWVTIVKFLVIGNVYSVLLAVALLYAVLAGLSS